MYINSGYNVCSAFVINSLFLCLLVTSQTVLSQEPINELPNSTNIENVVEAAAATTTTTTNKTNETLMQTLETVIEPLKKYDKIVQSDDRTLDDLQQKASIAKDSVAESADGPATDFVLLDSVSTNSGIKGMPDIPSGPAIITLVKNTAEIKLENVLHDELAIDGNGTTNGSPPLNPPSVQIDDETAAGAVAVPIDIKRNDPNDMTNEADTENQTTNDLPIVKEIEFPQNVPPDGGQMIIAINDSGGGGGGGNLQINDTVINKDSPTLASSIIDENNNNNKMLNLTVDENQIPVFSEWTQKRMEEAEKKMELDIANTSMHKKNSTSGHKAPVVKLRVKNYASPDCGAKIIAANSEASSTGSVLSTTKDEYLLSPCTSRIWFVVELCEAIQAEIIDLANFELFSSSPKNFSVSVSNRFPTREWSNVGRFTANDERNIQTFDLSPHLFGKYVRVDIHSHYNSEHFCPISLFRVYGTSEFEAFETENRIHVDGDDLDDDHVDEDDDMIAAAAAAAAAATATATADTAGGLADQKNHQKRGGGGADNKNNNIFKSASDAVMSIVKKAASLVKPSENKTNGGSNDLYPNYLVNNAQCMTPSFQMSCRNCSQNLTDEVEQLLSCKQAMLNRLLSVDLIRNNICKSRICANTVEWSRSIQSNAAQRNGDMASAKHWNNFQTDYISHLFPISYVAAMCNLLAANEKQTTQSSFRIGDEHIISNDPTKKDRSKNPLPNDDSMNILQNQSIELDKNDKRIEDGFIVKPIEHRPDQIDQQFAELNPIESNDQRRSDDKSDLSPSSSPSPLQPQPTVLPSSVTSEPYQSNQPIKNTSDGLKSDSPSTMPSDENAQLDDVIGINNTWENIDDAFLTETTTMVPNDLADATTTTTTTATMGDESTNQNSVNLPSGQKVHSESVFLRLSNRIKALERNMSLSGQYLDELSRRYKKQVEELQQSFAKALQIAEEQNRHHANIEQSLSDEITVLRQNIDQLTDRIFSWSNVCFYIGGVAVIQVLTVWILFKLWTSRRQCINAHNGSSARGGGRCCDMNGNGKMQSPSKGATAAAIRRKSLDETAASTLSSTGSASASSSVLIKRRPSEEALNISGTYEDLLIADELDSATVVATSTSEEYDTFGECNKRKIKQKNRKSLNGKRDALDGKRKKLLARHESAPSEFEMLKTASATEMDDCDTENHPALDENYDIYLPGSDFVYNEFMPDGPSGVENLNHIGNGSASPVNGGASGGGNGKATESGKTRRLSSPAFLKSPFSRSQRKKVAHESTGWEWYRLKKEPAAATTTTSATTATSQSKMSKKSKSESPEVRLNGLQNRDSSSKDSIKTSASQLVTSEKKHGSFRRILKKVF